MRSPKATSFGLPLLFSLVALLLSGCGVKGPLEPPPVAKKEGEAVTGAGTPGTTPQKKAHRPFILDGLLR